MVLLADTETREIPCANRCGAALTITISDDSRFTNREQEEGQIDQHGWEVRDAGVYCPRCVDDAPLSRLEEIDLRVDMEAA